ncbi:hypothetical protein QFZ82_001825 [Streptomyces sp. V4I23]|nr:hypothetical protein [Streptomyces sp. V4I23]
MPGSSSGSSSRRCVALPFAMHTPVVARHVTTRWLGGRDMSPDQRSDAVLIVSGPVTDTVRHGRSRRTPTDLGGDLDIAVGGRIEDTPEVRPGRGGDVLAGPGPVLGRQLGGPLIVVPGPGGRTVHSAVHLNGPAQVPPGERHRPAVVCGREVNMSGGRLSAGCAKSADDVESSRVEERRWIVKPMPDTRGDARHPAGRSPDRRPGGRAAHPGGRG